MFVRILHWERVFGGFLVWGDGFHEGRRGEHTTHSMAIGVIEGACTGDERVREVREGEKKGDSDPQ